MTTAKTFLHRSILAFISLALVVAGMLIGASSAQAATAGIDWTSQSASSFQDWHSITYGNGLFVAVSFGGAANGVMTSPDGVTWTNRTAPAGRWQAVTYGNGLFVAVGGNASTPSGYVMTSPDGITWTLQTLGAGLDDRTWYSVTSGNGKFVAVSINGATPGHRVMYSTNGTAWTIGTGAADNVWTSVGYGNGKFVAVSQATGVSGASRVMYSTDGMAWSAGTGATAAKTWFTVTYGNGRFVAIANNRATDDVMTSTDGVAWTSGTTPSGAAVWSSVTYGSGLFVAVGTNFFPNQVMTSPDGFTWTVRSSTADNAWTSVTYAAGLFVAVATDGGFGHSQVMTSGTLSSQQSSDPTTWTVIPQGMPTSATGTCDALDDKLAAYGTGITGGWVRSWQPWVNTTIGANGQRIGGWACIRTLINKGGPTWVIAN